MRAAIAQVGGKKQLIGATDLDVAIANQCGRLAANVIIAYNTILLSVLLERYRVASDHKALGALRTMSADHVAGRLAARPFPRTVSVPRRSAVHRPRGTSRRRQPVA